MLKQIFGLSSSMKLGPEAFLLIFYNTRLYLTPTSNTGLQKPTTPTAIAMVPCAFAVVPFAKVLTRT